VAAGVAKGEVVHIDSSLVRADVSWDAIARVMLKRCRRQTTTRRTATG
jgi:hypothetical protein